MTGSSFLAPTFRFLNFGVVVINIAIFRTDIADSVKAQMPPFEHSFRYLFYFHLSLSIVSSPPLLRVCFYLLSPLLILLNQCGSKLFVLKSTFKWIPSWSRVLSLSMIINSPQIYQLGRFHVRCHIRAMCSFVY